MKLKKRILLLLVGLFLIIFLSGFVLGENSNFDLKQINISQTSTSNSDWKSYTNYSFRIQFNHPPYWELIENPRDKRIELAIPYRPKGQNHDLRIRIYNFQYWATDKSVPCPKNKFPTGICISDLQKEQFAGITADKFKIKDKLNLEGKQFIQVSKPGYNLSIELTNCAYPEEFTCKKDLQEFLSSFQIF